MTSLSPNPPFRKRRLLLMLVGITLFCGATLAVMRFSNRQAEVKQAVRASFPLPFCTDDALYVTPCLSPLWDYCSYWLPPGHEGYVVGCDNYEDYFGPAFGLDATTCEFHVLSLTLASNLDLQHQNGSKMRVCPPGTP